MKIITPESEYISSIESYKKKMQSLKPGSRVLIKSADPSALSEALIGNWELNLVSIPVDPISTSTEIMAFIEDNCSPHAIVSNRDNKVTYEFLNGGILSDKGDYAIFYSSGTTGFPKGILQTREGLKANGLAVAKLHGFNKDAVHLTALPLYHCNASAMSLFGMYFAGGTSIFLNRFTPENYFKFIDLYNVETANLVPTFVSDLVSARLSWPASLKYVLTAASALSQEVCRSFFELYGPRLRQGYGLSEAINFSFTMPLLDAEEFKRHMVDHFPAVGLPVPGTEFKILNNEVLVRGPNNMREYWKNSEATKQTITEDGWIRTGDIGELRDGFLVLTGRLKEIIIKGGENLSPVMLEDEYRRNGVNGDFAVVGCRDERLGENIALILENYQNIKITKSKNAPACVRFGKVKRTQTKKPRRNEMRTGLISLSLPGNSYENELQVAGRISRKLLKLGAPRNAQQVYLLEVAKKMSNYAGAAHARAVVQKYYDLIETKLEAFWNQEISGHSLIKEVDSWEDLMCLEPMGNYAKLAADFVRANNLLKNNFLEVGSGVGNFTRLIVQDVQGTYTRTDISKKFLMGKYNVPEDILNIDEKSDRRANIVIGVNVFHCSTDPKKAIMNSYDSVIEGGYLIFAEGAPDPGNCGAWSLDLLFGFIDGWWDNGGFRERKYWLDILSELNGHEFGYSVLREGAYDLGGLYWIKK